jgi:hypothetical protein
VIGGAAAYYGAVRVMGVGLVRYVAVPRDQAGRLRTLTTVPYFSAILLASSGIAESNRNATAVAIRPACNRRWSEWIAVVAVLHSARNLPEPRAGESWPQPDLGKCGSRRDARLCRGAGAGITLHSSATERDSTEAQN